MNNPKMLANTVPVDPSKDLKILYKRSLIFFAISVGLAGFASPFPSGTTVYTALNTHPINVLSGILISGVLIAVSLLRNRIVFWIARRGFFTTFRFDSLIRKIFYIAFVLIAFALYPLFFFGFVVIPFVLVAPLAVPFFLALEFIVPPFVTVFDSEWKIGKLALLQFLMETENDEPNEEWLRLGLRKVELRLLKFGLFVPRNRLFFGYCFAQFQGDESVDSNVAILADWLVSPEADTVRPILRKILKVFEASR